MMDAMKWDMQYVHEDHDKEITLVVEHLRIGWFWTAYDGYNDPLSESRRVTTTPEEAMADAAEWLKTHGNEV